MARRLEGKDTAGINPWDIFPWPQY
jgi:hypothetical protein